MCQHKPVVRWFTSFPPCLTLVSCDVPERPQVTVFSLSMLIPNQDGVASSRLSLTRVITASTKEKKKAFGSSLTSWRLDDFHHVGVLHNGLRMKPGTSLDGGRHKWPRSTVSFFVCEGIWWAYTHTHTHTQIVYVSVFSHMNSPSRAFCLFEHFMPHWLVETFVV